MVNKGSLTKTLSIAGTVLLWLPVLAPLVFGLLRLLRGGPLMVDFLMPAELAPVVLVGAGLVLWASIRAKWRWQWVMWLIIAAVVLLVGSQALAVVTGLADGRIAPEGWQYILTLGGIIAYDLVVIALGVVGILLCKDLFNKLAE